MPVDAAALLAQVLPVGVLVLVLESRRGVSGLAQGSSFGQALARVYWIVFIVGSLGGTTATAMCVGAVIDGKPLSPIPSIFVGVLSYVVFLGVSALASLLMFSESGLVEAQLAREKRRAAQKAERKAASQGRHEAEGR